MDRKTKEILKRLEDMRRFPWEPGTKVLGLDVHRTIDIVHGLTRSLGLGTVFTKREREEKRMTRLEARRQMIRFRENIDCFLTLVEEMNEMLTLVVDGVLVSLGYHRHDRGSWRLRCDSTIFIDLRKRVDAMKSSKTETPAAHTPSGLEPEALKLFARARNGDDDALKEVQAMIRDRNWVSLLGDLGQEATLRLLEKATNGDLVWKVAIVEYLNEFMAGLAGDNPSVLEKLLVRRIVNDWITLYSLEQEYVSSPANSNEKREYLDKAISRAHTRYSQSIRELTHIRRLQVPKVLSRALRHPGRAEVHDLLIPMNPAPARNTTEDVQ